MPKVTTRTYRIRNHSEEGQCPGCGWFLDIGDTAVEIIESGDTVEAGFCSKVCAEKAIERS